MSRLQEVTIIDSSEKVTFAWWNTGLSPNAKSRGDLAAQEFALQVIETLIVGLEADFIALGEISSSDLVFFQKNNRFEHYAFISAVKDTGKMKVDLAYVVNVDRLSVASEKSIISIVGGSSNKVAHQVVVQDVMFGSVMSVFISHWPSRMFINQFHAKRHALSLDLRSKVDEILINDGSDSLIVLLGDYNDEPFSPSLSDQLRASRDRSLVCRSPQLLYNPFWGALGDTFMSGAYVGSYYYAGGETTKWYTFDQIIFSHGFIKAKHWRLAERCSYVAALPELVEKIVDRKSKFDHLPVFGIIERV